MILLRLLIIALPLLLPLQVASQDLDNLRMQLIENQRNILQLRNEKQRSEEELQAELQQQPNSHDPASQARIEQLVDDIAQSEQLIQNISNSVSQQRLDLLTLERGSPPSSLEIALNKALNSNLPELAKNLSNNEAARKEIARLQALLKEEARVGTPLPISGNAVSLASDQQIAEEEFLRVLSLFSDGEIDNAEDKTIKVSGISHRTPYVEEYTLNYLGHQQYHMEATVFDGNMTFTVDGRPWQLSVNEDEDGATYIVIYDTSDQEKPRLVMFNKTLLLE
jgi:hypothetical protein